MRCDKASPRGQADFQWECWNEISKGAVQYTEIVWKCGGVFWYMNVAFIRTKVQKLMWVSEPIGNGIFYCHLLSSGDKQFYQQISEEYIHQLRLLQPFALCLAPLFFPRLWFSVALCNQHGFLHVQIQLSDPQKEVSLAVILSFWIFFPVKLHLWSNWISLLSAWGIFLWFCFCFFINSAEGSATISSKPSWAMQCWQQWCWPPCCRNSW